MSAASAVPPKTQSAADYIASLQRKGGQEKEEDEQVAARGREYSAGEQVEAYWPPDYVGFIEEGMDVSQLTWWPATVTKTSAAGGYDLHYADGNEHASVPLECIRPAPSASKRKSVVADDSLSSTSSSAAAAAAGSNTAKRAKAGGGEGGGTAVAASPPDNAAVLPANGSSEVKKGQKRPLEVKEEEPVAAAAAAASHPASGTAPEYNINSITTNALEQVLRGAMGQKMIRKLVAARPFRSAEDAQMRVDGLGPGKINVLLKRGIRFPG
eukprot:SAG22_NODE_2269_length_2768_cov_6.420757_1_plen_268_part_10